MAKQILYLTLVVLILTAPRVALGQTTEFTFQGRLLDNTLPPTGNYDFEFTLFDSQNGPGELGAVSRPNVEVLRGVFSVILDFGEQFDGGQRFLEIALKPAGSPDPFQTLSPRQAVSSAPYSIRSLRATSADAATNADQLGGVEASQYVVTTDFRLSNERPPAPGSQNYIQNSSLVQNLAEFNIGGTGKAGSFDSADGYQIDGLKVLGITGNTGTFVGWSSGINNTGVANTFVGAESGTGTTTGANNSFFGYSAGNSNIGGFDNSFFGTRAGLTNTGQQNSFFGNSAGQNHTTGFNNSFFGWNSGFNSLTASSNSFFGARAGFSTTTGVSNSFFGARSGDANTTGLQNVFMGFQSGFSNTIGDRNVFIGQSAGFSSVSGINNTFVGQAAGTGNQTGSHNLALGSGSGFTQAGLTFATAVGPGTLVSTNNTIQLGRITQEERVLIPGDLQVNGAIIGDLPSNSGSYIQNGSSQQFSSNFNISGTGTASAFSAFVYQIGGSRVLGVPGNSNTFVGISAGPASPIGDEFNSLLGFRAGLDITSGARNSFFGTSAGESTTTGSENAFFGSDAGTNNSSGTRNVFLGYRAGLSNQLGVNNTFIGQHAGSQNTTGSNNVALGSGSGFTAGGLSFATAIGPGTLVSTNNTIQLGRITREEQVLIPGNLQLRGSSGANWEFGAKKVRVGDCNGVVGIFYTNDTNETVCNSGGILLSGARLELTARPNGEIRLGPSAIRIFSGLVHVNKAAGGGNDVCSVLVPGPDGPLVEVFSVCSSSIRYKTNVADFGLGRALIDRLRPVSFNWISDGKLDLGLIAEEVAAIEPLLATYNEKGEVEGVKYDRIGVVLINAVKEQQTQIEEQARQIAEQKKLLNEQQRQIDGLERLVCLANPQAEICRK